MSKIQTNERNREEYIKYRRISKIERNEQTIRE